MEGYLQKWVNPFHRWQKRYFILNNDILTYCDEKGGKAKGQIHLKVAGISWNLNDPLRIVIYTGINHLILKANDSKECHDWVTSLKKAQERCNQHKTNYCSQVDEILVEIWTTMADFDLYLTRLADSMGLTHTIQELQSLGNKLKTYITLGCQYIEQEKKNLYGDGGTEYESFDEISEVPDYQQQYLVSSQSRSKTEGNGDTLGTPTMNIPSRVVSLARLLEQIKFEQPIKHKILRDNPVFNKIKLTNELERDALPFKQDPDEKLKIWSFLKDLIGKDLTRVPMPLIMHQPLSALQMMAGPFEHFDLIQKAAQSRSSAKRMGYVIAFTLLRCLGGLDCQKKYFNPVLGETYEFIRPEYEFIAEQVSHHPPISAVHCEGHDFRFDCQLEAAVSFTGTSLKATFPVHTKLQLKKYDEWYTFKFPDILVKNFIFGKMYFENCGSVRYFNHKTGDHATLVLKERNWDGSNACNTLAIIQNMNGVEQHRLHGFWDRELYIDNELIWSRKPCDKDQLWQYGYSKLQLQLNYINADILKQIPVTDSRMRADIHALEYGWKQLGQDEKERIEEKQRERRKQMESAHQVHMPKFFELKKDQMTGDMLYTYKGNYNRDKHIDCLDLF